MEYLPVAGVLLGAVSDEDEVVADDPARGRYELRVAGKVAGFVTYRAGPGKVTLVHTEIEPEHEGQGLGSRLARATLDDIRAKGLRVEPRCPFMSGYIRRHPEYGDLLVG